MAAAVSPSSVSMATTEGCSPTFEDLSMDENLVFTDGLKDLRSLSSQLYAAAEYFEFSYANEDHKQPVMDNLKDYVVQALMNTIDHLGSMSLKMKSLLEDKAEDASQTQDMLSCVQQRVRTSQAHADSKGLSLHALPTTAAPRLHKRYILPVGENAMPGSGRDAVADDSRFHLRGEDSESRLFQDAVLLATKGISFSFRNEGLSPSPPKRAHSKIDRSPSPTIPPENSYPAESRADLQFPASLQTLLRSGSVESRVPTVSNSPSIARRFTSELQKSPSMLNSSSMRARVEKEDQKENEQIPSKSKHFLKSLLSRRKSRKDDLSSTHTDE